MRIRISRTAREQLAALEDADLWFDAWNELRRLQRGDVEARCATGTFATHPCPGGAMAFRVSRPAEDLVLIWSVALRGG